MFSFTNLETIWVGMHHLTWWTKIKKTTTFDATWKHRYGLLVWLMHVSVPHNIVSNIACVHNECANNSVAFHLNYKIFNMNFSCAFPKHMFVPTFGCHLKELRKITLNWFRFGDLTLENGTPYCKSFNTGKSVSNNKNRNSNCIGVFFMIISVRKFVRKKTKIWITTTCKMRSRIQLHFTWWSWKYWKQS